MTAQAAEPLVPEPLELDDDEPLDDEPLDGVEAGVDEVLEELSLDDEELLEEPEEEPTVDDEPERLSVR